MTKEKKDTEDKSADRLKKSKKAPLPMKLRALPQSFWQEPKALGAISPTFYKAPFNNEEERLASQSFVVGVANIELLFSLFKTVQTTDPSGRRPNRRGRPRKNRDFVTTRVKDEDPYISLITAPEVKLQQKAVLESKKVIAMMEHQSDGECNSMRNEYSQRLNDLVVNL